MNNDGKIVELASGKQLFVHEIEGPTTDSPTIFFLHGLGSSHTFYEAPLLKSKLRTKFRLIRYDFNGHGLSPLTGDVSIESLAEDLKAVMDYAGVERAAGVVGHSMSGLVATTFAARYPERVDKLLLIGPMKAMSEQGKGIMAQRATMVRQSGLASIVDAIAASATSAATKRDSPLSLALIRALVLGTKAEAYAAACEALAAGVDPDYTRIDATDVVVLGGAEDYLSNAELIRDLCESISNSWHAELSDVGHWHCVEDPQGVAEHLDRLFL